MVYCGKPSKACAECRLRRTKCDTLIPSCSQCLRAGRICTGYRTEIDMMFRDQTQHYGDKRRPQNGSRRAIPRRRIKAPNITEEISVDTQLMEDSILQLVTHTTPFTLELSISPSDQATCYFFRNYVLEDKSTSGSFQYLHDIYSNETVGPALADSIESLGMVGLAHFWKTPNLQFQANRKYNSALRLVSSRLRNEEEARADQTLVSVMLLGLYETNTCTGSQSMKSWTKHIIGASSLMLLRGKRCLETPIGRNLFVHLRTQIITNCLQRHASLPPFIHDWSRYILQFQSHNDAHATILSGHVMKFCDLRATMLSFHDYSNARYIIVEALAIESKLLKWSVFYPSDYHYHVYDSVWAASIWNHYRCVRILLNEIVYVQLAHLKNTQPELFLLEPRNHTFSDSQIEASITTVIKLSHEICASVPFMLGYKEGQEVTLNSAKAVSGNLLLWPLYTAACTPVVSDMMCHWVAGRLRVISDVMGINQAAPLSHILIKRKDLSAWELEDVQKGAPPKYEDWTHGQLMELT